MFPIRARHIVTGVHLLRVTQWHIGHAHEMCHPWKGLYIIFSMFSPRRISTRSCLHFNLMCELRSQDLVDSPPKMCVFGVPRDIEEILKFVLLSSIQVSIFG